MAHYSSTVALDRIQGVVPALDKYAEVGIAGVFDNNIGPPAVQIPVSETDPACVGYDARNVVLEPRGKVRTTTGVEAEVRAAASPTGVGADEDVPIVLSGTTHSEVIGSATGTTAAPATAVTTAARRVASLKVSCMVARSG